MKIDFYRLLVLAGRIFGSPLFALVSRIIAFGYFCVPERRRESLRFYVLLYPQRSHLYHFLCTFRQFQNFTTIHYDRFLVNQGRSPKFTSHGLELLQAGDGRKGAILLMSHLGNWEIAARLLMRQLNGLRLLLYMGIKEKEGVEGTQKEELRQAGVTIIGVDKTTDASFSVVDGVRLLQDGGVVSMTGDIVWQEKQRCLDVEFLGSTARIPEAPFVFALVSGAPIHVFFAFRTGTCRYHFTLSQPIYVQAESRAQRSTAIAAAAQKYATLLEEALCSNPLEWYHFDRFVDLRPEAEKPGGASAE